MGIPCSSIPEVKAIIGDQLIGLVNATHPMVLIINYVQYCNGCNTTCSPHCLHMVPICVSWSRSPLLSFYWCLCSIMQGRHHCDNIVVHPPANSKVHLVVHAVQSVESVIRDILHFLWWPSLLCSCSTNTSHTKVLHPLQYLLIGEIVAHCDNAHFCVSVL